MTHLFDRYTAAGNTFLVMNTWERPLSLSREEMREFVRGACDYNTGAGADGFILINQPAPSPRIADDALSPRRGEEQEITAFRMDFYNPDGTTGMLCGNGARCAAMAARNYGFVTSDKVNFEVLGAINIAEFLPDDAVRVYFQDPTVIRLNFSIPLEDNNVMVSYVDLGSQHVVVFCDDLDIEALNVEQLGSLLRWHPEFAPVGANANFIEVREDGEEKYLRIRTFERGVEGETLACGTGCMSSAIVARMTGRIPNMPIRLLTQSGEFVTVNFILSGEHVRNLSLEGNVVRGEEGTLTFDEQSGTVVLQYT